MRCLAPPPGDYEVHIQVSKDKAIVVNNAVGVGLKTMVLDEALPFLNTFTRPLSLDNALKLAGITLDRLLCMVIDSLEQAAKSGSITARRRAAACRGLMEEIRERCSH